MPDQALQWVDATGAVTAIRGGSGVATAEELTGRFAPSMRFTLATVPLQPGQRFRQVQHGLAEVALPIVFWPASATALRTLLRAWARLLDPVRGDGALRVTAPGGDQRELVCRYSEGLERLVEDDVSDFYGHARCVLHFIAEQPYWQDVSDTVASWSVTTAATFFPIFPLRLSASEVFADVTVTNDGDVIAWPVWTVTGPGSSLILRNLTSGELLSLPTTLAAGETVTIDTRPGHKTVTLQDGSNLFGSLSSDSTLWSLAVGVNAVRIEISATTPASLVALNWRRRWLSA